MVIKAIAPFAGSPWSSIAIGNNQDQLWYLAQRYQGIGRLIRFASGKPIALTTWRAMQEIENGVTSSSSCGSIIGRRQVDEKRSSLSVESRTDNFILYNRAIRWSMAGMKQWRRMETDVRRKNEQIARPTGKQDEDKQDEHTKGGGNHSFHCSCA